jgi:hypothetical protein
MYILNEDIFILFLCVMIFIYLFFCVCLFIQYTIKQFYRRTNSVGDRNEFRRLNNYQRNTSVGIIVVGNSPFRH